MNNDKLRVAIAVACGWRWREIGDTIEWIAPKRYSPPDYPNDLNAMHEAEKALLFSQRQEYYLHLQDIISRPLRQNERVALHECIRATAAQRAEAFARVMGVWEDGL